MNIDETERLIAVMRQHGVSHFKSRDVEIQMGRHDPVDLDNKANTQSVHNHTVSTFNIPKGPEPQAAPPVENEIPHHVNEVANLLKLSDEDLVDKMFPDYSQMGAKE